MNQGTTEVVATYIFNAMLSNDWSSTTVSFWIGFVLAMICIFGLQPLSTEKIQYLKEWDELLLS